MPTLMSGEFRICADCTGSMRKLPGLNDIWMCEICSGVRYRLPTEWEMSEDDEDETIYKQETSGE